ncbi:MAG: glycosyltransferase [Streptomyces sp.]|uniref:glycosyltransferase n=1 Tax=Streptomyces sp. TaxID=1931 RepID=UPI0025FC911D|nr:glycosyltransferase [Streptomyces sp.]MBW8792213.1 glycosyltransferase [Streptomyces sp.]
MVDDTTGSLDELLAALVDQTAPPDSFELVIVDASSTGRFATLAGSRHLTTRVVSADPTTGHGECRDIAWRTSRGRAVAYLDAAFVPNSGWVTVLAGATARGRRLVSGRFLRREDVELSLTPPYRELWRGGPEFPLVTSRQLAVLRSDLEAVGGFGDAEKDPDLSDLSLAVRLVASGVDPFRTREAVAFVPLDEQPQDRVARVRAASRVLADHPRARARLLLGGVFWQRRHLEAALLVLGLGLAAKDRRAALLALPWAHERTCLTPRSSGRLRRYLVLPGVLAADVAETTVTLAERLRP